MFLNALLVLVLAVAIGWLAGMRSLARRVRITLTSLSWLLCLVGSVALVVVGSIVLSSGAAITISTEGVLGDSAFHVDRLTGLFLVISFAVAVPAILAATSSRTLHRSRLAVGVAAVLLAMAVAIAAGNLFILLAGWEGLGFAFYLVVGYDRDRAGRGRSSVLAAVFSKVSGAALLLGGLLLFSQTHSLVLATFAHTPAGPIHDIAYALLVFGFGVKVGLMPTHLWLPFSYAAAPGPARAVLAGAAVNVGFYGLWRTMEVLSAPPIWLACILLLLAGITAVLGISHATVHVDLAYMIAWSSVENAGVILAGFGVAMVGEVVHNTLLVATGLVAATAQVCAHALGKSLLFVSTSAIEEAYGTTDLDVLRGVVASLRFSGAGLVVGALTLAGVPLTAGFASEWLILESLMQQFRVASLPLDLCLAIAGVLVALTIGIASVAFVRLIALTAFGRPVRDTLGAKDARVEHSWLHRSATSLLILGCLGAAMVAPWEMQFIARGISPLAGGAASNAVHDSWILQPVFANFSALSPTWLWIVIPGFVVLIGGLSVLVSGGRMLRVRRVPAWISGSPGVRGGHGYTSFGFANPIRKVLAAILLTRSELRREEAATGGRVGEEGEGARAVQLGYTVDVVDVVERYLYRPLVPLGRAVVHAVKKLQSGRLDAYMAYMLVAVLAVLAVVVSMANR